MVIRFYIGDPDEDGELINTFYEGSVTPEILLAADLPQRDYLAFKVDWIVPADLDYQPRIYAVIDPDDDIEEIHESNNKGNALLEIEGLTNISTNIVELPLNYSLEQNFPNPFNPETTIRFRIPEAVDVELTIYNIRGQVVLRPVKDRLLPGYYSAVINGNQLSSGMYFYRIKAGKFVQTKKLILLK